MHWATGAEKAKGKTENKRKKIKIPSAKRHRKRRIIRD
jgi:hypothetical protein